MAEPATCGEGLAANAGLPAAISELLASLAAVFQGHLRALDPDDPTSRPEVSAYAGLARAHLDAAASLARIADQMRACRDLPDGIHNVAALAAPGGQAEAYSRYLAAQRDLASLLAARLAAAEA